MVVPASPPGSRPTHLYAASYSRSVVPARYANWPISTNSGITDSPYDENCSQMLVASMCAAAPGVSR